MDLVLLTALGVGGATIIGALTGFAFKKITHTFSDIMLSFAAGVMLAAAVMGLVLPSMEHGLAMFGEADATTLTHKLLALLMTVKESMMCCQQLLEVFCRLSNLMVLCGHL